MKDDELMQAFRASAVGFKPAAVMCAPELFEEVDSPIDGMVVDQFINDGSIEFHLWGTAGLPSIEKMSSVLRAVMRDNDSLKGSLSLNRAVYRSQREKPQDSYHLTVTGFAVNPDAYVASSFLKKLATHMRS